MAIVEYHFGKAALVGDHVQIPMFTAATTELAVKNLDIGKSLAAESDYYGYSVLFRKDDQTLEYVFGSKEMLSAKIALQRDSLIAAVKKMHDEDPTVMLSESLNMKMNYVAKIRPGYRMDVINTAWGDEGIQASCFLHEHLDTATEAFNHHVNALQALGYNVSSTQS